MLSFFGVKRQATRAGVHPPGRFLGYVKVQVASRVYDLRVEALPLKRTDGGSDGAVLEPGFVSDGTDRFRVLVDSGAPEAVVKETIARASEDAARHISRTLLN
jgi:hypothetical protein